MVKGPVNRLHSLWPESSADGMERARELQAEITTRLQPWVRRAESIIGENPRAMLALATTIGATFGWLIKRR